MLYTLCTHAVVMCINTELYVFVVIKGRTYRHGIMIVVISSFIIIYIIILYTHPTYYVICGIEEEPLIKEGP